MISVASAQGDSVHPKLPRCVREECDEGSFHSTGKVTGSKFITHHYTCANCQAHLEYRHYGALGLLVWIGDPYIRRLGQRANEFFREVQTNIENSVARLPAVPEGLHVYVQESKGWRKLQ